MKKLMLVAAVLYGTYWYASRHMSLAGALAYAKKNPQASWAPAADYYVGLAYYQRAEYAKSQEAFTQLLTDYATGPYTAKGLLRLSSAAEENRDYAAARQSLERFIEEFPGHKDKSVAEKRLEIIKFK
ncbi:MAG: outer membrane protein assembly factor BamD [Elusimicrobia bacterium]|nr:outer membrane protein assembly factor BamD [Elusimicrobiota bacterium]